MIEWVNAPAGEYDVELDGRTVACLTREEQRVWEEVWGTTPLLPTVGMLIRLDNPPDGRPLTVRVTEVVHPQVRRQSSFLQEGMPYWDHEAKLEAQRARSHPDNPIVNGRVWVERVRVAA